MGNVGFSMVILEKEEEELEATIPGFNLFLLIWTNCLIISIFIKRIRKNKEF